MSISCRKVSHTGKGNASSTMTKPSRCNFKSTSSVIFVDLNQLHHHGVCDVLTNKQENADKQQLHTLFSRFFNIACLGIQKRSQTRTSLMIVIKGRCMALLEKWGYTDIQYHGNYRTRSYVPLPLSFPWGPLDTVAEVMFRNLKQTKKVRRCIYNIILYHVRRIFHNLISPHINVDERQCLQRIFWISTCCCLQRS